MYIKNSGLLTCQTKYLNPAFLFFYFQKTLDSFFRLFKNVKPQFIIYKGTFKGKKWNYFSSKNILKPNPLMV